MWFKEKLFDNECHQGRKCFMSLKVAKDKENDQTHLHEYKRHSNKEKDMDSVHDQIESLHEFLSQSQH